jgi:hypothetical protein
MNEEQKVEELLQVLEKLYTSEKLKKVLPASLVRSLSQLGKLTASSQTGKGILCNIQRTTSVGQKKSELIELLALLMANSNNFNAFLDEQPTLFRVHWREVCKHSFVCLIKSELDLVMPSWETKAHYSWRPPALAGAFGLFECVVPEGNYYGSSRRQEASGYWLKLSDKLISLTAEYFPELVALTSLEPVTEPVPENQPGHLIWHGGEQGEILREIGKWVVEKRPQPSVSGKVEAKVLSEVRRTIKTREFFPNRKGAAGGRATLFAVSMVANGTGYWWKDPESFKAEFHKVIVDNGLCSLRPQVFGIPHMSGTSVLSQFPDSPYFENMLAVVKELRPDSWYKVSSVRESLKVRGRFPKIIESRIRYSSFVPKRWSERSDCCDFDGPENLMYYVHEPLFNASLFMLGAAGMLDIIYLDSDSKYGDEFAGIEFIRVNSLGAFLLGHTDEFPSDGSSEKVRFHEDELSITLLVENERIRQLLLSIATPVTVNRFLVSKRSVLNGVTNQKGLTERVQIISRMGGGCMPLIWSLFLAEFLLLKKPFVEVGEVKVLKLSDDPQLRSIFTTDSQLRGLVVRAEGGQVIVPASGYQEVVQKLADYGYLM